MLLAKGHVKAVVQCTTIRVVGEENRRLCVFKPRMTLIRDATVSHGETECACEYAFEWLEWENDKFWNDFASPNHDGFWVNDSSESSIYI